MMNVKCPVCKEQWNSSLQVARHIFATYDKAHEAWVDSQEDISFGALLIMQTMESGNRAFTALAKIIEKAQDKM